MSTEIVLRTLFIGAGATLCMDIWALLLKRLWRIISLDYALPGRWLLWMLKGRFIHRTIVNTPSLAGEKVIGWFFHYATGFLFAFIPVLLSGSQWLLAPDLSTAITTALVSLAAPFLIMQPALGFGMAASATANPRQARLMSLLAHLIFGFGLYLSATIFNTFLF
ncbi:DUF2938 domain-containing protein [Kalamiella sp. sgz302252]|uniref:DUF2938 domain-containing protein n=1 Tax=Pantoea sp. sgz302252 TaxID=3341827 RepID=UPI0036D2AF99